MPQKVRLIRCLLCGLRYNILDFKSCPSCRGTNHERQNQQTSGHEQVKQPARSGSGIENGNQTDAGKPTDPSGPDT